MYRKYVLFSVFITSSLIVAVTFFSAVAVFALTISDMSTQTEEAVIYTLPVGHPIIENVSNSSNQVIEGHAVPRQAYGGYHSGNKGDCPRSAKAQLTNLAPSKGVVEDLTLAQVE